MENILALTKAQLISLKKKKKKHFIFIAKTNPQKFWKASYVLIKARTQKFRREGEKNKTMSGTEKWEAAGENLLLSF